MFVYVWMCVHVRACAYAHVHVCSCVQDLDSADLQNKDLYLACQVIKFGKPRPHSPLPTSPPPPSLPPPFPLPLPFTLPFPPGNYLEGKQTANPMRKALGAAVLPLHSLLTSAPSNEQEEKDVQMEVYT